MKGKLFTILLALMLVLGAVGCAGQEVAPEEDNGSDEAKTVTVTHGLGETTVAVNPERVVVIDYGALDVLDYVGIEVVGLGKTASLPDHLSKYADEKYIAAGSLHEPDFEAINELQPDLIIIGARASTAYDELVKIAPTVLFTMPTANYMDTFRENLNLLSQIFTEQADVFAEQTELLDSRAAEIFEKAKSEGYTALTLMVNDGEMSVFGKNSRFSIVYDDFGFSVSDEGIEESTHGQSATFEYIAEQNPDYLFVIDRSAATGAQGTTGAQAVLDNELIGATDAAQNGTIVYLDSTNWYVVSGGISSTHAMIEEVEASLK